MVHCCWRQQAAHGREACCHTHRTHHLPLPTRSPIRQACHLSHCLPYFPCRHPSHSISRGLFYRTHPRLRYICVLSDTHHHHPRCHPSSHSITTPTYCPLHCFCPADSRPACPGPRLHPCQVCPTTQARPGRPHRVPPWPDRQCGLLGAVRLRWRCQDCCSACLRCCCFPRCVCPHRCFFSRSHHCPRCTCLHGNHRCRPCCRDSTARHVRPAWRRPARTTHPHA